MRGLSWVALSLRDGFSFKLAFADALPYAATVLERVTSLLVAEYILYHLVFTQVKQRVEGVTWDFYIQPPAIAFLGEIVLNIC